MITPAEKIQIMRQYEANPGSAILALADLLRREMQAAVDERIKSAIQDAVSNFSKDMPNLDKVLESIKGQDGEDASPEDVAAAILSTPGFSDSVRGERGFTGNIGPKGPAGARGEPGRAGKDGADGNDGKPGKDGREGPRGPQGAAGGDGSPDKPEQIAQKLNKTEESVDMSVIRGLRKWMQSVQSSVRSSSGKPQRKIGGGGSIVEYYDLTSQCNGVTRTFTLPANRRVLSVHGIDFPVNYRPAIDWTASGRILTLSSDLNPPGTGQTLYCIYVH